MCFVCVCVGGGGGGGEDYEDTDSKIKDWMLPCIMMDFMDHKKQKHSEVVVVLSTGVAHYNTKNMDIKVGGMQDEVQIKIIWPNNMTDVTKLLHQFMYEWHVEDLSMQQCLAMEKTFTLLKEKETDFVWSKVSIPLLFFVQSMFEFEFIYDHENGFWALMIHLVKPDRKHKMIQM